MTITETVTLTPAEISGRITEHLAARLNGLDIVDGAFVRTTATIGQDGYLVVDVTRWEKGFCGPDGTLRVLLHPTLPVDVTPAAAPEVELTGDTALDVPAVEVTPEPATPAEPAATVAFVPAVGAP